MLIDGRYALLRCLGRGGMAEVYLAKQFGPLGFEKLVVVKRPLPLERVEPHQHAAFHRLFEAEARLAADLRHPNIVSVQEVVVDEDVPHIVMQYLHGVDLAKVLRRCRRRRERLGITSSIFIAQRVAAALHAAHTYRDAQGRRRGLIHRDVTPQNIVMTFEGQPVLVDFGIARATAKPVPGEPLRGKVGYFAPEQVRGEDATERSDQFMLGIVLYEMLTGRRLFYDKEQSVALDRSLRAEVPALPKSVTCPRAVESVLRRMLHKEPEQRFEDCESVVNALDAAATTSGIAPRVTVMRKRVRQLFADVLNEIDAPTPRGPPDVDTHLADSEDLAAADEPTVAPTQPALAVVTPEPLAEVRQDDFRVLQSLLRTHDVVALTGPPGVGKSTLGASIAQSHPRPVSLSLKESSDVDRAFRQLARTLDADAVRGNDVDRAPSSVLRRVLRAQPGDSFFVIDGLRRDVGVKLSVLLRESGHRALFITREAPPDDVVAFELTPLSCAHETPGSASDAARFFLEVCGTAYTKHDWALIEDVVSAVDGLPHGIVVAAAYAQHATLTELRAWLFDHGAASDKLHTLFERAVNGLEKATSETLEMLALLPTPFDADLAEQITGHSDALKHLFALTDAGLARLVSVTGLEDEIHFDIYRNVEIIVSEALTTTQRESVRRRRDEVVLKQAAAWTRATRGPGTERALHRLRNAAPTLRCIRDDALAQRPHTPARIRDAARAALALDAALTASGYTAADAAALHTLEDAGQPQLGARLFAQVLETRADVDKEQGRLREAKARYLLAHAAALQTEDRALQAIILKNVVDVSVALGDVSSAERFAHDAVALCDRFGDRHLRARVMHSSARLSLMQRRFADALTENAAALDVFRHVGDIRFETRARRRRGDILFAAGRGDDAETQYLRALELALATGERDQQAKTRARIGRLLWLLHKDKNGAVRELRDACSIWRAMDNAPRERAALSVLLDLKVLTDDEQRDGEAAFDALAP